MSAEQVYIVDELKKKMKLLSEKLSEQKNNSSRLLLENNDLEEKIKEQEEEIKELKRQNNTLKLAKAFIADSGESQEAKLEINRIVREIDKCIALLNR